MILQPDFAKGICEKLEMFLWVLLKTMKELKADLNICSANKCITNSGMNLGKLIFLTGGNERSIT